jgi:ABC-2 type transport system permease protein
MGINMNKKWKDLAEFGLWIGILICINILLTDYFFRLDLTGDKRYSVSPVSEKMLENLSEKIYVEVYLSGSLDPDYQRLKKSIKDKLDEFDIYSAKGLEYRFVDPNAIADKKIRENYFTQLVKKGIQYRYYLQEEGGKKEEKIIFPGAILAYKGREVPVMFVKGKKVASQQEELNQAVEGVEFELISGLRKLSSTQVKHIAFVEGQGELSKREVSDISTTLSDFYQVDRIQLQDSSKLSKYATLIIAAPAKPYTEKQKFVLDQYLMHGGSLMFLVDALNVHKDSLVNGVTYALPYNLNLEDLLFRYGVRVNQNLVQDKFSGVIRVQTTQEQNQVMSYPFYPVIYNYGKHPIVRNLDAVLTRFANSIDTVKADGVSKLPLLYTSKDTRVVGAPIQIDLNSLRQSSNPELYTGGVQHLGVLLEGKFTSLYKNKPLPITGVSFKENASNSKVMVISDGDIIRNEFDTTRNQSFPLGYDMNMRYQFSNKEFLVNAIDYLAGEEIVNVRGKEIKLRPLDQDKITDSIAMVRIINLVLPIVLLIVFGIARYYFRKKKYTSF